MLHSLDQTNHTTHAQRYQNSERKRDHFLGVARECAKYTIPSIYPEGGTSHDRPLRLPHQSYGAGLVNTLATNLIWLLFPPNTPYFRLKPEFNIKRELDNAPEEERLEIEASLALLEKEITGEMERRQFRVVLFEALKHLIIGGNVLLYLPKGENLRLFPLSHYIVERDPSGNILEIITQEVISFNVVQEILSPDEQSAFISQFAPDEFEKKENELTLYTRISREKNKYILTQEIEHIEIEKTKKSYSLEEMPYLPIRMVHVASESYGRSHTEENLSNLTHLNQLYKTVYQTTELMGKVYMLVHPNSTLTPEMLAEAESGDVLYGEGNQVDIIQIQKHHDLTVIHTMIQTLQETLGRAFLSHSSIQRHAERVTAEEIREMSQELERTLGGIYSLLAQEVQLPLVKIIMSEMGKTHKNFPKFNKKQINPVIATGMAALGRDNDLYQLNRLLEQVTSISQIIPDIVYLLNPQQILQQLITGLSLDPRTLIKSKEQLQQEQEQEQLQQQEELQTQLQAQTASALVQDTFSKQKNPVQT